VGAIKQEFPNKVRQVEGLLIKGFDKLSLTGLSMA
jgi:hypothetical protein